jgi:hypothetical protein
MRIKEKYSPKERMGIEMRNILNGGAINGKVPSTRSPLFCLLTSLTRGDRVADWFSFEHKSHFNREIKMHAVQFGLVGFKRSSKPTKPMRLESVRWLRFTT